MLHNNVIFYIMNIMCRKSCSFQTDFIFFRLQIRYKTATKGENNHFALFLQKREGFMVSIENLMTLFLL